MLENPELPKEISNLFDKERDISIGQANGSKEKDVGKEPAQALLRFLPPGHVPEVNENRIQLPNLSEFSDTHTVQLHSIRPIPTISELKQWTDFPQLHTHRFTAVQHPISLHKAPFTVQSFKSSQLLKEHLVPATIDMLKQVTGCKIVMIDTIVLRDAYYSDEDAVSKHDNAKEEPKDPEDTFPQFIGFDKAHGGATPAPKVHTDYTAQGARNLLRYYHPLTTKAAEEVIRHEEKLLGEGKELKEAYKTCGGPRWAMYSVWRPLRTVKRDALAVADYRTFEEKNFVPLAVRYPRLGLPGKSETYSSEMILTTFSQKQKWYWIDSQTSEEVWVIKFFDTEDESPGSIASGGAFHSSVHLPGSENEAPRESLECRVTCIW